MYNTPNMYTGLLFKTPNNFNQKTARYFIINSTTVRQNYSELATIPNQFNINILTNEIYIY